MNVAQRRIGLDIGTGTVRLAEVEGNGRGGGTVVAYAEAPTPPGAVQSGEVVDVRAVGQAIKQAHGQGGFQAKEAILGIGMPSVAVREIEIPELPMGQLRSSLAFQVRDTLPISADEALLDFYPTSQREVDGKSMLRGTVVAAPKLSVSQTVLAAESAGLKPVAADLSAFALLRAQMSNQVTDRTVALVDVGSRVTTVIVAQHGAPRLVRVLPNGGGDSTDAVAQAVSTDAGAAEDLKRRMAMGERGPDMDAARAAADAATRRLVEAIRNTFVYFASNNPGVGIDAVLMTGGGALTEGFGQHLASASRLPVTYGSGLGLVSVGKKAPREYLQSASIRVPIAVGLALVVK